MSKSDANLIAAINRMNELVDKFNRSDAFFQKYPEYEKTNPKDFKILAKKIDAIVAEIGELNWINQYKSKFKTNEDGSLSYISPSKQTQVKLF